MNRFQSWHDILKSKKLTCEIMKSLTSLYDARSEKYPIYHSGILAFVITTCLPLNVGISRLPVMDVIALLLAGFVSLFMLARNDQVGMGLLNHLRIPDRKQTVQFYKRPSGKTMERFTDRKLSQVETLKQDPFTLIQNALEHIITTHDEHLDSTTRVKLAAVRQRLHEIAGEISNA